VRLAQPQAAQLDAPRRDGLLDQPAAARPCCTRNSSRCSCRRIPARTTSPMPATAQLLAAVVRPRTVFLRKMITPAPRKPLPLHLPASTPRRSPACWWASQRKPIERGMIVHARKYPGRTVL
jgi:hypothetical protein